MKLIYTKTTLGTYSFYGGKFFNIKTTINEIKNKKYWFVTNYQNYKAK